ncbi:MAG: HAD-IA family hydrolase [Armatimonadetes bacterium]|nr:HAD-IA family hydrolase [Armatimonadota bacterium]
MIKAVIFDMDGVLLDSEPLIREAAMRMFAEHGIIVQPEDFKPFVGAGEDRFIGGVAEKYGFPLDPVRDKARTYEIYADVVDGKIEPLNGAHEFIAKARAKGLKLAVASSADQIKIDINLKGIGIPLETFDAIVSGSDVTKKKPNPEGFLKAAEKLGIKPEQCLVVEDAINGVQASKAAGMRCLAVTTSFTPVDLAAADWIAADLAAAPDEALNW